MLFWRNENNWTEKRWQMINFPGKLETFYLLLILKKLFHYGWKFHEKWILFQTWTLPFLHMESVSRYRQKFASSMYIYILPFFFRNEMFIEKNRFEKSSKYKPFWRNVTLLKSEIKFSISVLNPLNRPQATWLRASLIIHKFNPKLGNLRPWFLLTIKMRFFIQEKTLSGYKRLKN